MPKLQIKLSNISKRLMFLLEGLTCFKMCNLILVIIKIDLLLLLSIYSQMVNPVRQLNLAFLLILLYKSHPETFMFLSSLQKRSHSRALGVICRSRYKFTKQEIIMLWVIECVTLCELSRKKTHQ